MLNETDNRKALNVRLSIKRCLEKTLFAQEIFDITNKKAQERGEIHATQGLETIMQALHEDLLFAAENLEELDSTAQH